MMATTVIEEMKKQQVELINIKEELLNIKSIIITEQRLTQILKEELSNQESKNKDEFERIQIQVSQIKINNNPDKSSGLDFSDFQMPPDLPWGNTLEPKKNKNKSKLIKE